MNKIRLIERKVACSRIKNLYKGRKHGTKGNGF